MLSLQIQPVFHSYSVPQCGRATVHVARLWAAVLDLAALCAIYLHSTTVHSAGVGVRPSSRHPSIYQFGNIY